MNFKFCILYLYKSKLKKGQSANSCKSLDRSSVLFPNQSCHVDTKYNISSKAKSQGRHNIHRHLQDQEEKVA